MSQGLQQVVLRVAPYCCARNTSRNTVARYDRGHEAL